MFLLSRTISVERRPSCKLVVAQLIKETTKFCANRRLIAVFTKARRWSLHLNEINPAYILIPYFLRSLLMMTSHLQLSLPGRIFLSVFTTKRVCEFVFCCACATCPAHRIFHIIIIFSENYKLWLASLCDFIENSVSFFLWSPNIPVSTFHWCSSRSDGDDIPA